MICYIDWIIKYLTYGFDTWFNFGIFIIDFSKIWVLIIIFFNNRNKQIIKYRFFKNKMLLKEMKEFYEIFSDDLTFPIMLKLKKYFNDDRLENDLIE